jgi:hypothetical protein
LTSFIREVVVYSSRVRVFSGEDWLAYIAWVGLMVGLLLAIGGFTLFGAVHGVQYPPYVWSVPVGTAIFVVAIAFDTIGHRTVYKAELAKGEALVHHITIFAGISSCLLLCLAYRHPVLLRWPVVVMSALSVFYSVIDEAMHWRRYLILESDRVEMWSHFFIFTGHLLMILSWLEWYFEGYPGVRETLAFLSS